MSYIPAAPESEAFSKTILVEKLYYFLDSGEIILKGHHFPIVFCFLHFVNSHITHFFIIRTLGILAEIP